MEKYYAFFSKKAADKFGSYHETEDGVKYTAIYTDIERSKEYMWSDKKLTGIIYKMGKLVVTNTSIRTSY